MRLIFFATFMLTLAACGGGGGQQTPELLGDSPPTTPADPPRNEPVRPSQPETHIGASLREDSSSWSSQLNPKGLPPHGRDGLRVEWAKGQVADVRFEFAPYLSDILEPRWRFDRSARNRLFAAELVLWKLTAQAYMQWTRHLDYDPGAVRVVVGDPRVDLTGHCGEVACYEPESDRVVLVSSWVKKNYFGLHSGSLTLTHAAISELFHVLTHEAGHQFHYENHDGTTKGCTGPDDHCHAPDGSGSVMSYDRNPRSNVTAEDIHRIPNATWNGNDVSRYTLSMSADAPALIDGWGVWIDHRFRVNGNRHGGNLSITDGITGTGWVRGMPSTDVSLTGTATWSGEDNFLGVALDPDYLGAVLRADANLCYTFGDRPNLNLRVSDFEAHYGADGVAAWYDRSFTDGWDFSYSMDCTSGGCSGDDAEAKWYADGTGDPSGWVGGVVNDRNNAYTGSFVAERD